MIDLVRTAFHVGAIQWQKHALERMLARAISRANVAAVIATGEVIEAYPDDSPFPSLLVPGLIDGRALHVVVSFDIATSQAYVITAYEPNDQHFAPDRKTRLP